MSSCTLIQGGGGKTTISESGAVTPTARLAARSAAELRRALTT
jgi:hypothetical protein